jgi:4-hydroxyphenylacetate 3-monooxygenase
MVTFELFAQAPPFAHLNAVYQSYNVNPALEFVKNAAGLGDVVMQQWKKK